MPQTSTADIGARNSALLDWYRENRRELPWRRSSDPYRILVSEVMSQQTQILRVVPRYERFLIRFPTIDDLAAAPLRDVLEEWSGLGYPARARRLWETARIVNEQGWPDTTAGLRELPGIGPYTAAALASFAFGRREPAVDTNLRRVLSRWQGEVLDGIPLRATAGTLISDDSATWNQAIMDLAAAHCGPRAPHCDGCPVSAWCSDPSIDPPRARQGRFEGSVRQIRGKVLRRLAAGDAGIGELHRETGADAGILDGLVTDGLIACDGSRYRLGE